MEPKANTVEKVKPLESIDHDDRIDDFAIDMFKRLGHDKILSDDMCDVYTEFKRRKDKILPGRISPEAFAFVTLLADISSGAFKPGDRND